MADSGPPTPPVSVTKRGDAPASGSRRQRGLWPRDWHQRAPHSEAHPLVPSTWPESNRSYLADMHGGTTVLLAMARPLRSVESSPRASRALSHSSGADACKN